MNKEKSIVSGLFRFLIIMVVIVFGVQITYQTVFFPNAYKYQVVDNIESELNILFESSSNQTFFQNLDNYAAKTQTSNLLVPADEININKIAKSSLIQSVTVINDSEIIKLILPSIHGVTYHAGVNIDANIVHLIGNYYYPTTMTLDNKEVYITERPSERQITGKIIEYNDIDASNLNSDKAQTFSNELFNYFTNNTRKMVQTDYGYYYISLDEENNDNNIVYLSLVQIGRETFVLFSIYQLEQITYITKELALNSFLLYFSIVIILLCSMNRYFRTISIPLKNVSRYLKRIAKLDFSNPLKEQKRKDEIGEIISSVNQMSANLQNTLAELERQKEQISRQMERELDRDQINKDFVAGLSHELKTPLAVMKASFEAIAMDILPPEDKEYQFEVIQVEIDKCNRLIKDMIKVYEIESPDYKKNYEVFNIKDTILKVDKSVSIIAESKNIEVVLDLDDAIVNLDSSKLELVISNFYSNAVKYTDKNEKIFITLKDLGELVHFEIINTGASIPEDAIDNLFEPFFRVNKARSRELGSTGLGLYIIKQILDQMGISFGVENIEEGVMFYFDITRSEDEESHLE